MRDLVREDCGDGFFRAKRGVSRIGQQLLFAEGDRARIFHGARRKVGDADDVQLSERVADPEVMVVEGDLMFGGLEGEAGQRLFVGRRADTQRDSIRRPFATHEIADQQRHEIGRHLRGAFEFHRMPARLGARRIRNPCAVGDGDVGLVHVQRDVERRFVGRLVKAGKRAARVGRFHL